MENTIVPKKNYVRSYASTAIADWKIIEYKKPLLVIEVAGKTLRMICKPLVLKGKPRYKVPPDCDPTMW